jgi:gamma-glutamyl hercynylcysteine S-oxide synthase
MSMSVCQAAATQLVDELRTARAESDRLFEVIKKYALYERPIDARHRVIFYIGHLDGFDSIQICRKSLGIESRQPQLDALFEAGIDPDSAHLPADKPSDWPSLNELHRYVRHCRDAVDQVVDRASEDALSMALEHRLMHLETLAYMFHNFGYEMKHIPPTEKSVRAAFSHLENHWCEIPEGNATLGKPDDGSFGWDNEYQETRQFVLAFAIQQHSVTNREYLRFVHGGAAMPHFWTRRGDVIYFRGMFAEVPLPPDWPVYVTHAEAQAYADWVGKKLPSEEQFHRAAFGDASGRERQFPWGTDEPAGDRGNFNFKRWDPESVYSSPSGASAFGVTQMVGNGWQWTRTPFAPFPGFEPRDVYPGYSANFFDGEHYVMKGGSSRTASRLLRRSFRNWFRRDYPYMYATFRCVED